MDSLAVFVHKDNPIKCLTLQQIDAIFSKSRKGGAAKDAKTWGDLGLTENGRISRSRFTAVNSASGTYGFFKEVGPSMAITKTREGAAWLFSGVQELPRDKYAIGIRE